MLIFSGVTLPRVLFFLEEIKTYRPDDKLRACGTFRKGHYGASYQPEAEKALIEAEERFQREKNLQSLRE